MCFKFLSIFFVLYAFFITSSGEQCYLKFADDDTINWSSPNFMGNISKTAEEGMGGSIKWVYATGPIAFDSLIQNGDCAVNKYFKNSRVSDEIARLVATSDFSQWDNDRESTSGDCSFQIKFKTDGCDALGDTGTTVVPFNIRVDDVNLSEPKFQAAEYDLTVRYPMESGAIVNEGTEIFANDYDFSTEKLEFSMKDQDASDMFKIEPLPADHSSKRFGLLLRPKRAFALLRDMKFEIEASDNFLDSPKIGSTTVNIIVNESESEAPMPQFEHPLYEEILKRSQLSLKAALPISPKIALKDDFGASNEDLTVEISTNEYFAIQRTGVTVELLVQKAIDQTKEPIIVDVIARIRDKVDTTTVWIIVIDDDGLQDGSDSDNTALLASTIVLALLTACLLGASGYVFWNYNLTKKASLAVTQANSAPSTFTTKSEITPTTSNLQVENEKTRSMTFTENDEISTTNRESGHEAPNPGSDSVNEAE